jgi:hypothetical protein
VPLRHAKLPLVACMLLLARSARADSTLTLDGTVESDDVDHVFVDFEVPAGTDEIQIDHDDQSDENILDWGLYDPNGFRGGGGGNSEPIIVSPAAASRSYLTGSITPGTWRVVIGKAKLVTEPAPYHIVVTLRDVSTLPDQPEREQYVDPGVIVSGERWYAGDFHVHSKESGDARPPLDEIVTFAKGRGLDFVELSDHNTVSQLDFMNDAQSRAGEFLLLPGVEFTTYDGHANGIGATAFVDHKIGLPGVTIEKAAQAFADQGAIFSINHPTLDLGDACIGCAWKHELDGSQIGAIEIATAGSSTLFLQDTLDLWESYAASGHRLTPVGGSDDHQAGTDVGAFGAPIGSPCTMVLASELSVAGIIEGVRSGRTVVKVRGPDDPMIELASAAGGVNGVLVSATITGGAGLALRWVSNGESGPDIPIEGDPFTVELDVAAPAASADRYRVEVWEGTQGISFSSHLWVEPGSGAPAVVEKVDLEGGNGCSAAPAGTGACGWVLFGLALAARSRVSRSKRRSAKKK